MFHTIRHFFNHLWELILLTFGFPVSTPEGVSMSETAIYLISSIFVTMVTLKFFYV